MGTRECPVPAASDGAQRSAVPEQGV